MGIACTFIRLYTSPSRYQGSDEENDENKEQYLGDRRRAGCDAEEPEDPGDDGDDEENNCPA